MEIYNYKIEEKKIIKKEEYKWEGRWMFNSNWIWENNIIRTIGNEVNVGKYSYLEWNVDKYM